MICTKATTSNCIFNNSMNKAAQSLGRRAKGVPKTITEADRARRAAHAKTMAAKRWAKIKPQPEPKATI